MKLDLLGNESENNFLLTRAIFIFSIEFRIFHYNTFCLNRKVSRILQASAPSAGYFVEDDLVMMERRTTRSMVYWAVVSTLIKVYLQFTWNLIYSLLYEWQSRRVNVEASKTFTHLLPHLLAHTQSTKMTKHSEIKKRFLKLTLPPMCNHLHFRYNFYSSEIILSETIRTI